jgi:hypothetical protein
MLPRLIEGRICRRVAKAETFRSRRRSAITEDEAPSLTAAWLRERIIAALRDESPGDDSPVTALGSAGRWIQRDVGAASSSEIASERFRISRRPFGIVADDEDQAKRIEVAGDNEISEFDEYVWCRDPQPRRQPSDQERRRAFQELVRVDPTWFARACAADDALMKRKNRSFNEELLIAEALGWIEIDQDNTKANEDALWWLLAVWCETESISVLDIFCSMLAERLKMRGVMPAKWIVHVNPDIVFGAVAIEHEVSRKPDRALRSIEGGKLPVGTIGDRLCASSQMLQQAGKNPRKQRAVNRDALITALAA